MMMNKYFSSDSVIVPTYIFEADEVTPAGATDVIWEYVNPETDAVISIYVEQPSAGPDLTLTAPSSGTMDGSYDYIYTNIDDNGFEGASSPISNISASLQKVEVELPAANAGIAARKIYRRQAPNEVFRLRSEQGTAALTFEDDLSHDDDNELRTPSLTYGNSMAKFSGPAGYFDTVGLYILAGRFTLLNGTIRTTTSAFQIVDPLAVATTDVDKVIDMAWGLLEDCFDSIEGGPWLQDETKAIFDEEKFADFFNLALFNISIAQPPVTYDVNTFPYSSASPLLAKGILLEAIKHLMRSYVEQPLPVNDPTMHLQRRDYLDRWKIIYDLEKAEYDMWLLLFKRDAYGFGQTAILVGGQSGLRTPRILRTRYPRFAGGWWGRFVYEDNHSDLYERENLHHENLYEMQ